MATVEQREPVVERRSGWMVRLISWASQTADRSVLVVWIGWTTLSWTLFVLATYFGAGAAISPFLSLVMHSTVFALVAAAAFVRPHTVRSVFGPIILYLAWSLSAALIGVIQIATADSSLPVSVYDIGADFISSFGARIWLGVSFYLVSQFLGICVTHERGEIHEVLTLKKLMAATLLAATAFALMQVDGTQQFWAAPDAVKLVHVLTTTLGAIIWGIVLWTQISSRRVALLLIILTAIGGVAVSEFLHVAVWSRMEIKQAHTTLGHPSVLESALSWLMSMLGIWIALRIAGVGGYQVKRTSASLATSAQLGS